MPRLATFLKDEIQRREWSVEEFARRTGISVSLAYQILRDGKTNVRQATLAKIAAGLGMSTVDLLLAADAECEADPIEQAIRQRTAQMREIVDGIPQVMWATIIGKIFDHAIDGARDIAELLSAEDKHQSTSANEDPDDRGIDAPRRPQRPIKPREPAIKLAVLASA